MSQRINEDVAVPDHDATTGQGSFSPGPVDNGSALRPADNPTETDADIAIVGGQPVPREQQLAAIVARLQGLDPIDLQAIYDGALAQFDINNDPTISAAGRQGINLQSIAAGGVTAAVNEIFAGEDLSDEFKTRAAIVFEAVVNDRVKSVRAQIQESYDAAIAEMESTNSARIDEAVESVTNTLVESLDVFTTSVADRFLEVNQPLIENTIETVAAGRFMEGVIALAENYNIRIPTQNIDAVATLTEEVASLQQRLDEEINNSLNVTKRNIELERAAIVESATAGMSALQAERAGLLIESANLAGDDIQAFASGVQAICESVNAAAAPKKPVVPLNEGLDNGMIVEGVNPLAPRVAPSPVLAALSRMGQVN